MKILHLASQFFPEYSGSSVRLYYLLSNLPYKVELIVNNKTIKGKYIPLEKEQFGNISVYRISLDSTGICGHLPFRYLFHLGAKSNIKKIISQDKGIKIIHAHETKVISGEAAMEVSRKLKIPFVCEIHANRTDNISGAWRYIHKAYANHKSKQILHSSHKIVTLTYSLKDWLQKYYKIDERKITVVPNGVDIRAFSPKPEYQKETQNIREKLNISTLKVILYSGYMDYINGIYDLVKHLPGIIHRKKDILFLFIGQGPEAEKIKILSQKYPQNVKFIPFVSHEKMPIYYQLCNIFIIPRPSTISAETLVPLKLLEAMAMEKPVLASNVDALAEVIKHNENGYLFEKGNIKSFEQTLFDILDDDYVQIGKRARASVMREYTWEKSAKILQKVYQKLL